MCSNTVRAGTETKCLGLKAAGILYYYFLKLRSLGPCCMDPSGHLLLGSEERRMLRKGKSLEINGEKTATSLELAKIIRNTWAERLRLLFTTPVCHQDLLKIQRGSRPGGGVTWMCFSHHPHHGGMPVPSSFHSHLPPAAFSFPFPFLFPFAFPSPLFSQVLPSYLLRC